MIRHFVILLTALFFAGCSETPSHPPADGKALAKTYCGTCHLFPEPALLDKETWKESVLPPMAAKLGIDYLYETPVGSKPGIAPEKWRAIAAYYLANAPDQMPPQNRAAVTSVSARFAVTPLPVAGDHSPSTCYLHIDAANHRVYAASAIDSTLNIYDQRCRLIASNQVYASIVDMQFDNIAPHKGIRSGLLTNIGILSPNDQKKGWVKPFTIGTDGGMALGPVLLDSLPRPVQVTSCDLDMDGQTDYLVCGFGNQTGAFFWMRNIGGGKFQQHTLIDRPGAIRSYIDDVNHDGKPDIIVLMAQAMEGIYLFVNQGQGRFAMRELLHFPPVFGSSSFQWVDMNGDGYKDILYTCGDNADYSSQALKNYHGVYLYLNDGANHFSLTYFFPLYGCYKAMAADFDHDGDLDIAAVSYFPDALRRPQECFVYLQHDGGLAFTPFIIPNVQRGKWITMDVGDLDGDGYADILLGSLIPPLPAEIEKWKARGGGTTAGLVLHNVGKPSPTHFTPR